MPWYTAVECNRPPLYEAWVTFISEMTNNYLIWNILIYSVTRYHEERKFLLRVFTRLKKERQISTESAGTFRFYGNHQEDNFVFTDMSNQSHKYIFFACTLLSFFQDLANFTGWVLGAYGQERAIRNSSSRISFRVSIIRRTKLQCSAVLSFPFLILFRLMCTVLVSSYVRCASENCQIQNK